MEDALPAGWPLLKISTAATRKVPAHDTARQMSVVRWVMTSLPRRSPDDLELMLIKNFDGCQVFDYNVIEMSTSNFSSGNLIGKGGCNSVYKGVLPQGKPVAVKVNSQSSKESLADFMREIEIMTTLKHERITPLLGVCVRDDELISVYELLCKGNLEHNLHSKNCSFLSWEIRFRIAVGIGEALHYLHNECRPKPIIHRDVKSSNILLTEGFEPQLCDFGLAMWGPTGSSSFLTDSDVAGTFGYLAPEYFMYGRISDKIDVYAFGVLLLELLSGRRAIGLESTKLGQQSLVMWAKPRLESEDLESILDPCLCGNADVDEVQRVGLAARLCLAQAARLRPAMDQNLEGRGGRGWRSFEDDDDIDDEVYPALHAQELHLSLALVDVHENSRSFDSLDQNSPLSVEDYLKKRWSRSSSLD